MRDEARSLVTDSGKKITTIINGHLTLTICMEKLLGFHNKSAMSNDRWETFDELHCLIGNVNNLFGNIFAKSTSSKVLSYELQIRSVSTAILEAAFNSLNKSLIFFPCIFCTAASAQS